MLLWFVKVVLQLPGFTRIQAGSFGSSHDGASYGLTRGETCTGTHCLTRNSVIRNPAETFKFCEADANVFGADLALHVHFYGKYPLHSWIARTIIMWNKTNTIHEISIHDATRRHNEVFFNFHNLHRGGIELI